ERGDGLVLKRVEEEVVVRAVRAGGQLVRRRFLRRPGFPAAIGVARVLLAAFFEFLFLVLLGEVGHEVGAVRKSGLDRVQREREDPERHGSRLARPVVQARSRYRLHLDDSHEDRVVAALDYAVAWDLRAARPRPPAV